jgi:geranylgeranyl pyrophosphate synthase
MPSRNDNLSRNDLLNGDVTLPFIYALQSNIILDRDRKTITSVYMGETEKVDPTEVQRIYKKTGALDRSILKMKEFAEEGRKYLEPYERSEAKKVLNFMLDQYYVNFTPSTKLTVLV